MIASLGLVATSCDMRPTAPVEPKRAPDQPPIANGPPGVAYNIASFDCTGDRVALTVKCEKSRAPSTGAAADIIVGGQGVYMNMISSGVAYDGGSGQFTFNAALQNLIPQNIGTTDGTTLDPNGVRVFFNDGPTTTGGTGSPSVVPDGFATFTAAGQPYYQYMQLLAQNVTSTPKVWTLIVPPTVTSFAFHVYVSAPVQFPVGFIQIQPIAPLIHPDVATPLTWQVLTAVGNVVPGAVVTWSSTDPTVATVDPSTGVITPLKAGSISINGTDGTRPGTVLLNVSGTQRSWGGATNTDWNVGTNWPQHNIVAVAQDSVVVTTGVSNMPLLTAPATVSAIDVQSTATMGVGTFDLTVTDNVTTGTSGISSGSGTGRVIQTGGTVNGVLPNYRVEGTVTAAGDVAVAGTIVVVGGTLKNVGNTVQVHP